jgi:glutathione synthase
MALQREVLASGESQKIRLGLHRSDYMLHLAPQSAATDAGGGGRGGPPTLGLLQVELNTIASSFGCLSAKVTNLHKHLLPKSAPPSLVGTVPDNDAAAGLARGLSFAHREYLKVRAVA